MITNVADVSIYLESTVAGVRVVSKRADVSVAFGPQGGACDAIVATVSDERVVANSGIAFVVCRANAWSGDVDHTADVVAATANTTSKITVGL